MIFKTKVSTFKSTKETSVQKIDTIGQLLDNIKEGTYKEYIKKVREGDKEAKKNLPMLAFHGLFDRYRKKENFAEASGLIIIDIDECEDDLEEIKEEIIESSDNVLAAMISPSGDGIKVLYYVQADLVTADNYRQIGKQISSDYEIYGKVDYLSITDCLIATYDPNIRINKEAIPAFIYIKLF